MSPPMSLPPLTDVAEPRLRSGITGTPPGSAGGSMAIELQVLSATALVTSAPRERQTYEGRGDDRKSLGRAVDELGRPLSSVSAVVMAEPIGLLPDATVPVPDLDITVLVAGAVAGLDRTL